METTYLKFCLDANHLDELAHKYLHSLTIYLSEWVDTKEMQESLENILN